MKDIIVILGPTAVGKTKLSVELAKKIDAEIINGDSMLVYKGMNIGTAKITTKEKENIPHHLFDIVDTSINYTIYDYQRDCRTLIKEILSRGKKVIIVGGTGLYIKAALYNYIFKKQTTSNNYDNLTNMEILAKINEHKVKTEIHPNNRKRLVRLLNKLENNEEPTFQKDELLYDASFIALTTPRENLYNKINNRVDEMFKNNLLEEVNSLKNKYNESKALQSAIGYKEFIPYFNKEISIEEVKENIKKNSRHYAKRQYTFFIHQFNATWFETDYNNFENTVNEVYSYISNNNKKI